MAEWLSVVAMIALVMISFHSRARLETWFNPVPIMAIVFFLHNFSYTFLRLFVDIEPGSILFSEKAEIDSVLRNAVGFVVMTMAIYGGVAFYRRPRNPRPEKLLEPSLIEIAYVLLAVGSLFYGGIFFGAAGSRYGEGQAATATEAFSPVATFFTARYYFLILSPAVRRWFKLEPNLTFIVAGIGFETMVALLSGGRKGLFCTLLTLFLVWAYAESRKDIWKQLIAGGLIGYVLFVLSKVVVAFRSSLEEDISGRARDAFSEFPTLSELMSTVAVVANSQPLQAWVQDIWGDDRSPHVWGLSYVQAFVNLVIPRPFQGWLVNYQAAFLFKEHAYQGVTNMGYDLAFSAEAYMNFGPKFFWIPFALLGYALGRLHAARHQTFLIGFGNSVLLGACIVYFRSDSTALLRIVFIGVVPYMMLRWVFGHVPKKPVVTESGPTQGPLRRASVAR